MTTKILFSALVLLAIVTLSAAGAMGALNRTGANQPLMNYMMGSRFSNDPQVSVACFGYYLPILNNISDEFSKSFQNCLSDERNRMAKLNDDAITDRYQIELSADSVCVRLDACNDLSNPVDYLDCIAKQGADNSKILYTVTRNSTEKGAELREQYRIVKVDTYKCQNASERVYVEDTATTYKQLDICLQTGNLPSTTSPETTTPVISTTIQEQETTTVDNTSTDNPTSSTDNSSSSTDNPSASTDSTNASSTTTEGPASTPPDNEELTTGRGMKILSELRKFWRIK